MRRVLCLLLPWLAVSGVALAQDADEGSGDVRAPEAIEVLKRVDAAVKAVHSVRCQVSTKPSGVAENFFAAAEGTSVMVGWTGTIPVKFYSHVKTKDPRSGEAVELSGGGDGEMYFLIDHATKRAYEDMDPGVMGSGARALRGVGLVEFVHDAPFDDELGAPSVTLGADEVVGGEACYQIHVSYGGGNGESTWFFSKKDYLPRRRVRHFNVPGQGEGTLEIDVSRLEVNIEPDDGLFRMTLPEGYEQIDDFAP